MPPSKWRNISADPEFWMILFFNTLFVVLYVKAEIAVAEVIWVYYLQSVFIGIQYFIRLIYIARRSTEKGKWSIPVFFAFHYGLFHLAYLFFLSLITLASEQSSQTSFKIILYGFGMLLINTIFSTISDVKKDKQAHPIPSVMMFIPYLRVFPMHIFIILGFNKSFGSATAGWGVVMDAFVIFVVLKTISDVVLHIIINKTWKKKRERAIGEL